MISFAISWRALSRAAVLSLVGVSLGGCWGNDGLITGGVAAPVQRTGLGRNPALLVAATRRVADPPSEKPWFSAQRGRGLAFAEAQLAGPDGSLSGR